MNEILTDGYNIVPTPPTPPVAPPESKPRPFRLFSCGVQWSIIPGIVMLLSDRNGNGAFQLAFAALYLALVIAALGLVWGTFQHVLKTIVQIIRTKN